MKTGRWSFIVLAMMLSLFLIPLQSDVMGQTKDGVFIHVSSGDEAPPKILMALKMANIMSEDKDVLLYFDINGVEAVLKNTDEIKCMAFDKTAKEYIEILRQKGITMYVCPTCLKKKSKTKDDLLPPSAAKLPSHLLFSFSLQSSSKYLRYYL